MADSLGLDSLLYPLRDLPGRVWKPSAGAIGDGNNQRAIGAPSATGRVRAEGMNAS